MSFVPVCNNKSLQDFSASFSLLNQFFKQEFYFLDRRQAEESQTFIADLESINDDLDVRKVQLVKTCDIETAEDYGIEDAPALVYFENGIPFLYSEADESPEAILKWIFKQVDGDEIEDVTDEMLDMLVNGDLDGVGTIYCE